MIIEFLGESFSNLPAKCEKVIGNKNCNQALLLTSNEELWPTLLLLLLLLFYNLVFCHFHDKKALAKQKQVRAGNQDVNIL